MHTQHSTQTSSVFNGALTVQFAAYGPSARTIRSAIANDPLMKQLARGWSNLQVGYRHSEVYISALKRLTSMGRYGRFTRYWILSLAFVLPLLGVEHVAAASAPAGETQKIEALIQDVRNLKDATFIRNGSSYSSESAAIFLRRKWQANQSAVKTARDFIDKVASFSGTSGKPYLIHFKDGREIHSRDFLLARLKSVEG